MLGRSGAWVGSAASIPPGTYLEVTNNLSDLANAGTARQNLGFTTNAAGRVLIGDGSTTYTSEAELFWDTTTNQLGVNQATPGSGATLDVGGTAGGIGFPVLTTAQRDAVTPDRNGVVIYNSSLHQFDGYINGAWTRIVPNSAVDHGSIGGLGDDDHTQYALLAGRSGGQTLKGSTASGENLTLQSTSHATKGLIDLASTAYVDEANARVGIGFDTPAYRLHHRATADDYSHGFAMSHASGGANALTRFYQDLNGNFSIANPNQLQIHVLWTPSGQTAMADQHPTSHGASVGIRTHADYLSRHTLALTKKASQTGKLLDFQDTDYSSLASVTVAGAASFAGLTVSTLGAGLGLLSSSGVLSSLSGASGQMLLHDGTTWVATNRSVLAGTVALSSGTLTKAITFATAQADTNYSISWSFRNTIDSNPVSIPYRIVAKATTGFTIEWDEELQTANYNGEWIVARHYDP